jgi:hypothetical protein
MPHSLQQAFDALPGMTEGERFETYRARLTIDQLAVFDAFNKEVSDGLLWLEICN